MVLGTPHHACIKELLRDFGVEHIRSVIKELMFHARTKHIEIHYHFISTGSHKRNKLDLCDTKKYVMDIREGDLRKQT